MASIARIGRALEAALRALVVAEIVPPVRRRDRALCVAPAAGLVGRAGLDPVPVARDARRRARVPPRRAHAHDDGRQPAARPALRAYARAVRARGDAGVPGHAAAWPSIEHVKTGGHRHHAGAGDIVELARGGDAGRPRPDGAVRAGAAWLRQPLRSCCIVLGAVLSSACCVFWLAQPVLLGARQSSI